MTVRRSSVFALLGIAMLLSAACAFRSGWWTVPDRWNPWAPLRIEAPPDWLTHYKIGRLARDPPQCLAFLGRAELRFSPVPDRETGPGCGFKNAVRITAMGVQVGEAFTLSCRSAVALALWEAHVLQPAARAHLGAPVARIEHFGSYACRNVYTRKDAPLSRHATADAIDIAGFVLANGRRIRVARLGWHGRGRPILARRAPGCLHGLRRCAGPRV